MPVQLQTKPDGSIPVAEMRDGQIAEIVQWAYSEYVGLIVQRTDKVLLQVGKRSGEGWDDGCLKNQANRVRILRNGETLTVRGNE